MENWVKCDCATILKNCCIEIFPWREHGVSVYLFIDKNRSFSHIAFYIFFIHIFRRFFCSINIFPRCTWGNKKRISSLIWVCVTDGIMTVLQHVREHFVCICDLCLRSTNTEDRTISYVDFWIWAMNSRGEKKNRRPENRKISFECCKIETTPALSCSDICVKFERFAIPYMDRTIFTFLFVFFSYYLD